MTRHFLRSLALQLLALLCCTPLFAMQPPEPGMIERMKAEGTYDAALEFAKSLGTHELKAPRRGNQARETDPRKLAELIQQHMGQSLDALEQGGRSLSSATQAELNWMQLDLNHDRVVDERDLLALGYPRPKSSSDMPSVGNVNIFALLLDFEDYPSYFSAAEMQETMFGAGHPSYYYKGLTAYYKDASYNQLNFNGTTYGWHRASQPRTYYHPNDDQSYATDTARRNEVVMEAILAADAAGADFSQYDNDGDGSVDTFLCIWAGPHGAWSTFWWGYFGVALPSNFVVDGVNFTSYSWQWERYYGFGDTPPLDTAWDPLVTIHETGHALGIPDFYDYDGSVGMPGGVGGLDIMHGNWGDHGAFSKYVLGWLTPTIAFGNLDDFPLRATGLYPDAVIAMPGYDPVSPWREYFIIQNRHRVGLDVTYPSDGMLIWHVDARLNTGGGFAWNNSYTDHKLIALEQADGLGEIESGNGQADADDYYNMGEVFSPASNPNSARHDNSATNITIDDISADGETMTADFTLYTTNPPQVTINTPTGGDTITGTTTVTVTATDDVAVSSMQLLIDGQVVATATSGNLSYSWNSLVEFNKPLNVVARAWDAEGQSGSAVVGVTVNNAGATAINDIFTSAPDALVNWRIEHYPDSMRGQSTYWSTRTSPGTPARTGAGNEAYVRRVPGGSNTSNYAAEDGLRLARIDKSGFTRPLQLQFQYRNWGGLALLYSNDEGTTWTTLENLPSTNNWALYNRTLILPGDHIYFRFLYTGSVRVNTNNNQSGNIANFFLRETPSDPPVVAFTSPADGATLSGSELVFEVATSDDGTVNRVDYTIHGRGPFTVNAAPYTFTYPVDGEDNDPGLVVTATAYDDDDLPSTVATLTVALSNSKTWPFTDDFDANVDNWQIINDSSPLWGHALAGGRNSSGALGYFTTNPWTANNQSGVLSMGPELAPGIHRAVDLSNPLVIAPEASYWYNGQMPNNWSLALYFYSTWRGYQYLTDHPKDAADWERRSVSLAPYTGQSGRFVFWIFGSGSTSGGTGVYIDDFSIVNAPPALTALLPNSGFPGQVTSLTGVNFGNTRGASTISFNGVTLPETDYLNWSNTQIDIRVPDGASTGPVYVTIDGLDSNTQDFTVSPLELGISGILPDQLYIGSDLPQVLVTASPSIERVELYVDGVLLGESSSAPDFIPLVLEMAKVPNGSRNAYLQGYTPNGMFTSNQLPFRIYSLRGDLNGDGVIDLGDQAALTPLLGMLASDAAFQPWYDPDEDGVVSEADLSYIGYNFGAAIPAP